MVRGRHGRYGVFEVLFGCLKGAIRESKPKMCVFEEMKVAFQCVSEYLPNQIKKNKIIIITV